MAPSPATAARVLLVEDSPPYARLVELLLDEALGAGVSTVRAASLAAAVAHLDGPGADAVVLDLSLPDAQGLEAVEGLHAAHPGARVVVLSGRDDPDLTAELARRGVAFVRKGNEREQLGAALTRLLA